jgi:hypothetical protein
MSSLSKQLTALKQAAAIQPNLSEKERASILFSAKDAASINLEKISFIALEAYQELTRVVPELYEYQQDLFKPENKNLDR